MKYRLETAHYLWDTLLDPGTEIGDGTQYPIGHGFVPSSGMTPLDAEAEKLSAQHRKPGWGTAPEDRLPLTGDIHPVYPSPNNNNAQPIIPPPLEHLTRPNDMRPGEPQRQDPRLTDALAAENDRLNAIRANEEAEKRAREVPGPSGVSADGFNKGPRMADVKSVPGQGPAPKATTAPGQGPAPARKPGEPVKPPAPPSNQVPRNTAGVVPESSDGQFTDLDKNDKPVEDKDKNKK
jgi:hypothetical protein